MAVSTRILGEKYQLIRPLRQGGMGSVWLAEHLSLASPVAVKLIAPELVTSEELRQRFLQEAHAAAALRSPHVVQTLDYGVDGDTPYIVMELLVGESLADRLARRGCLTPGQTELVLRHVSRAVARAHELGIVHRDLKPANIFITRNDEEEVIKLFDFGIAKAISGREEDAAQTRTGSILGTPAYMSPEQLEGCKDCGTSVDIWAMGVIAYECLLGRQPFTGNGLGGLVLAVTLGPLPVPSQQGAVPEGFDAWFARACARCPSERFRSAREAARELRRVLTPELPEPLDCPAGHALPLATTTRAEGVPGATVQREEALREEAPREEAFLLRSRGHDTGPAASATVRQGQRRQRASGPLPALVMALALVLLAGYQLFARSEGPERTGAASALAHEAEREAPPGVVQRANAFAAPHQLPAAAPAVDAPVSKQASPQPQSSTRTRRDHASERGAISPRATAPRNASASLTITSNPPSHVLIDGAPRGTTPLHSLRVPAGQHRVTLIHGKQRKTMHVETSPGENTLLSARFAEAAAAAPDQPL